MASLAVVPAEAAVVAGKSNPSKHRVKHGKRRLSAKDTTIIGCAIIVLIGVAVWGVITLSRANQVERASYTAVRDAITVRLALSDDGLKMKAHVEETLEVEFAQGNKGNIIEREYRGIRPPLPVKGSISVHNEQGNDVPAKIHEYNTGSSRSGSTEQHAAIRIGDMKDKTPLQGKQTYHISYDVGEDLLGIGDSTRASFFYTLPLPKPDVDTHRLVADIIFPEAMLQREKLRDGDVLTCDRVTGKGEEGLGPCDAVEVRDNGKTIHIEQANLKQEFVWLNVSAPRTQAQEQYHEAKRQQGAFWSAVMLFFAAPVVIVGLIWWTCKEVAKEKANKDKPPEKPSKTKKRRVARKRKTDT